MFLVVFAVKIGRTNHGNEKDVFDILEFRINCWNVDYLFYSVDNY